MNISRGINTVIDVRKNCRCQRQIAYAEIHEFGHCARNLILKHNTDAESVKFVKQLDELYAQQLSMAVEDYRTEHGQQISDDLHKLLGQFMALPRSIADASTKQKVRVALGYIDQKLKQPGGLTELAVDKYSDPDQPNMSGAELNSLYGMIGNALLATNTGADRLYGINELVEDNPTLLDANLVLNTDRRIRHYLQSVFLSEQILPGDRGGHSYENSDEMFASYWLISGLTSADNFGKVLESVPPKYRPIARQQLETVAQLRKHLDPTTLQG